MKYEIKIGDQPITLEHDDFLTTINVDELTTTNHSNLFGELVTAAASANRIGLMKSEVQAIMDRAKLDYKMFEGEFKAKKRKEASDNGGKYTMRVNNQDVLVKLTETSLSTCFEGDPEWKKVKLAFIDAEKNFNAISSLYWSTQQKSRSLTGFANGVTPKEFYNELAEGSVNGILIKKEKLEGLGS